MYGQMLSHVVRRSVEQYPGIAQGDFSQMGPPAEIKLELSNGTLFAIVSIAIATFLIIASVDYTVGSVIATLTMIESPSSTTIIESAPPAYSDEPDAPLEKKGYEAAQSIEVVVVEHKPVTARILTAVKHLHAVGGFFGRWRGALQSIVYHIGVNVLGHIFGGFLAIPFGPFVGQSLGYFLSVMMGARMHMLWTHAMIRAPTTERWYKGIIQRKECKALLLPSAVYAVARQLTLMVPITIAYCMNLEQLVQQRDDKPLDARTCIEVAIMIARVLVVPVSALFMVLFVYLPAQTTLVRIEACLLPEDRETIVPFDREALIGDINMEERGSSKLLFKAAWKSFNNAARVRLVKLYVKLAAYQFAVLLVGFHLVIGVLYVTSREQMVNTLRMVAA